MVIAFGQPKSVSKVVTAIRNFSGGISQKDIAAATGLSERAVKYALSILESSGLVVELFILNDLRKKMYTLKVIKR